jgi:hypothetical protein
MRTALCFQDGALMLHLLEGKMLFLCGGPWKEEGTSFSHQAFHLITHSRPQVLPLNTVVSGSKFQHEFGREQKHSHHGALSVVPYFMSSHTKPIHSSPAAPRSSLISSSTQKSKSRVSSLTTRWDSLHTHLYSLCDQAGKFPKPLILLPF